MVASSLVERAHGRLRRTSARHLFKRPFDVYPRVPLVSFTFDDFPRSALATGGRILKEYDAAGTYYASLGLMGQETATGTMFVAEDLLQVVEGGHELGCHTFDHLHSWDTNPRQFEASIVKNTQALHQRLPKTEFATFSYPISPPRPLTKRRMLQHFRACRGGGQRLIRGTTDLGYLPAYFLEKDADRPEAAKAIIDENRRTCAWLIFATHDVDVAHTPFGCTPAYFREVVEYAVKSGARVVPVVQALQLLTAGTTPRA